MRKSKNKDEWQDPDLIPILNLVCICIPFLLMMVSFVEYAVINVNAPRFNQAATQAPPQDRLPLNLTVLVTDQGFTVTARGQNVGAGADAVDASANAGPTIPKKRVGGKMDYNFAELSKKMRDLKNDNDEESQLNIGAERNIDYETIVKVMDATRSDDKGELFPNVVLLGGIM